MSDKDDTCPNCGYCKHCGRSGPQPARLVPAPIIPYQPTPLQPPYSPVGDPPWGPVIPFGPQWVDPIKITCGDIAVQPSVGTSVVTSDSILGLFKGKIFITNGVDSSSKIASS